MDYVDSANLYQYADSLPTTLLDPLGLLTEKESQAYWNSLLKPFLAARVALSVIQSKIATVLTQMDQIVSDYNKHKISRGQLHDKYFALQTKLSELRGQESTLIGFLDAYFDIAKLAHWMAKEGSKEKDLRRATIGIKNIEAFKTMAERLALMPSGTKPQDFVIWLAALMNKLQNDSDTGLWYLFSNVQLNDLYRRVYCNCENIRTKLKNTEVVTSNDLYGDDPTVTTLVTDQEDMTMCDK